MNGFVLAGGMGVALIVVGLVVRADSLGRRLQLSEQLIAELGEARANDALVIDHLQAEILDRDELLRLRLKRTHALQRELLAARAQLEEGLADDACAVAELPAVVYRSLHQPIGGRAGEADSTDAAVDVDGTENTAGVGR